jgi:hypothetical protein
MRSIGVHRTAHQTFASQTASHDSMASLNNMMFRAGSSKPKVGSLASSQRTQLLKTPVTRTNFGGAQTTVVNSALHRVRSGGSVAPKKKSALPTHVFIA